MRHTARDRRNRLRKQKIGNKLRQQAQQKKRHARRAARASPARSTDQSEQSRGDTVAS